jgi:hypothetical protein
MTWVLPVLGMIGGVTAIAVGAARFLRAPGGSRYARQPAGEHRRDGTLVMTAGLAAIGFSWSMGADWRPGRLLQFVVLGIATQQAYVTKRRHDAWRGSLLTGRDCSPP